MTVDRTGLPLCVDLLGPLALRVDGHEVQVRGGRRRALLALLALESGRSVGVERLVESLWPDDPPDNAVQALYNHVSRLRSHLGGHANRLERHGAGYRLRLEPRELDVDAARHLARAAGTGEGVPASVAEQTRQALALWRGPALEEFRALPALEAEAVALEELRLQLVEELLHARLLTGDRGVAVDAAAAAAASPLRERPVLLQVRALAADGRTAEAMAAAQGFRRRLADETGLDPSPALAELEQLVATGSVAVTRDRTSADEGPTHARAATARPTGPLVGRQRDREELVRLLHEHPVVTVAGPGGVGKTRLASDIAAESAELGADDEDVAFVELAAVDRSDRVCEAVASALGLRSSGELGPDEVAAALADRRLLLVLDNCEHVLDGCRELVVALHRRARRVRLLSTSRVTLQVPDEYVVRLQPLPVPRDPVDVETLRRQPGVRAFVEHARRRRPGYDVEPADAADLVDVLRRLDGLPLGIELAARQVAVMPLAAVRERLDRALDLATGRAGTDGRQGTLRATIAWSYELLAPHEQRMLRALSPFPGGVDLETVEFLATATRCPGDPLDVLHRLVDASLVVADPASGRYRLLFTVRSFLRDASRDAGELVEDDQRFLDRCLQTAREIEKAASGPREAEADRRLRAELDNVRAARDLAVTYGRDDVRVELTLSLADIALWRDLRELWGWAFELVEDDALVDHPARPELLGCAAEAARMLGQLDRALELAEATYRAAGPTPEPRQVCRALSARGSVAHYRGDFAKAADDWLWSGEGRRFLSGPWLASAALAAAYGGDAGWARELLDEAHEANRRAGCVSHQAFAEYVEGELRAAEAPEKAVPHYERAIEAARGVGATFVEGVAGVALASVRTRIGDVPGAAETFRSLLDSWQRTGQTTQLWTTARNAARLLSDVGHRRSAALLLCCADEQPGAAAVSPSIARHSGRLFVPLHEVVDEEEVEQVRAEARGLGAAAVLDIARRELGELSRPGR